VFVVFTEFINFVSRSSSNMYRDTEYVVFFGLKFEGEADTRIL
jgi:hypothetical protein